METIKKKETKPKKEKVEAFTVIGVGLPKSKAIEALTSGGMKIAVSEDLNDLEKRQITERALLRANNEKAVSHLKDDKRTKELMGFCIKIKEHIIAREPNLEEIFHKVEFDKKKIKGFTNLSWSGLKTILDALEIRGLVKTTKFGVIFIQDEELSENVVLESLYQEIEELKNSIEVKKATIKDKETKKKLTAFKRKLSLKL